MEGKSAVVANIHDLQEGEMQRVSVEKTQILLAKVNGEFHAVSANCVHYGALLTNGALKNGCVVCPWHNARYNVTSGEQTNPPGLDNLVRFNLRVEGEDIVVTIPEDSPSQKPPEMTEYNPSNDERTFVILGAGTAGSHAAQTLRKCGFSGQLILIGAEEDLPYDRVMMSKDYLQEDSISEEAVFLRSQEFYETNNIELKLGQKVTKVNPQNKEITFQDDATLNYDALLLATGGKAINLPLPGADLENVFTLRSYSDSEKIKKAAKKAEKAVILGASFIGMETAASLTQKGLDVTVVAPDSLPFAKLFGEEIGEMYLQTHQENGVKFKLETKASQFTGNGKVKKVTLENGETLSADLVIVGVGVKPATDYLEGMKLNEEDNSLIADEYLNVAEGLYAAGDIATFPYWQTRNPTRIEHWCVAAQHGRIAARNMMGESVPYRGIPFFWTNQFDIAMRYAGHAESWDEIIFQGNVAEKDFIAFYVKDNHVLAVAANNRDTEMAAITELMRISSMPEVNKLREDGMNWLDELRKC